MPVTRDELDGVRRELSEADDKLRDRVTASITKAHDRINEVGAAHATLSQRVDRLDVDVAGCSALIKTQGDTMATFEHSLATATQSSDTLAAEIRAEREDRDRRRKDAEDAEAKEAADRKAWTARWVAMATPQNLTALVVIASAAGMVVQSLQSGEDIDRDDLLNAMRAAQQVEQPAETPPEPTTPTPPP